MKNKKLLIGIFVLMFGLSFGFVSAFPTPQISQNSKCLVDDFPENYGCVLYEGEIVNFKIKGHTYSIFIKQISENSVTFNLDGSPLEAIEKDGSLLIDDVVLYNVEIREQGSSGILFADFETITSLCEDENNGENCILFKGQEFDLTFQGEEYKFSLSSIDDSKINILVNGKKGKFPREGGIKVVNGIKIDIHGTNYEEIGFPPGVGFNIIGKATFWERVKSWFG